MAAGLNAFGVVDSKFSLAAKAGSLLALPFTHEDLAIMAGAYAIANDVMPAARVVAIIYGGIVISDFVLYGIGAGARHFPWLSRYAIRANGHRYGDGIKRNVFELVALCRIVPGLVSSASVACGWTRVPLARFILASLVVSALYLPIMLYLATTFGDALDDRVGLWAWPLLFVAISAATFMRRRVFAFSDPVDRTETRTA